MAAHTTTRSRAIGSSFVVPKNPAIRKSDSVAPPIASTLHQPNGTQNPTTARAARINTTAALPARKTPEIGYSPDAGIRPNSPPSPIDQGQAHLNRPPNVSWASLSKGTRYEAAKWACSTRSAAKSHFDMVITSCSSPIVDQHRQLPYPQKLLRRPYLRVPGSPSLVPPRISVRLKTKASSKQTTGKLPRSLLFLYFGVACLRVPHREGLLRRRAWRSRSWRV